MLDWLRTLSRLEIAVALIYLRYQNMPGGIAYPGASKVANLIGHKSVRHVRRTIASLESRGFITTIPGKYGGKISARRRASVSIPPVADSATGASSATTPVAISAIAPVADYATTPVADSATQFTTRDIEQNKQNTSSTTVGGAVVGFSSQEKAGDSYRLTEATEALKGFGIRGSKRKEILAIPKICAGVIETVAKELFKESPDAGTGLLIESIIEEAPELIRIYRWD